MSARPESSSPRADVVQTATAAALGVVLFAGSWAALNVGLYDVAPIVDTPLYREYGDAVLDGAVPYRDFAVEYPPGSLPAFVLPALASDAGYAGAFAALMLACGAAAVALVAVALAAAGASPPALYGGVAFAALTPLALGPVVLSRFDLWPALLTTAALAGLATGRPRVALAALAAAVAAKLYAFVLLPLALLYAARRHGAREAAAAGGAFVLVLALVVVPFALVAPDGLAESVSRQLGRPLQIESLGAGALLAAHRLGLYEATVESSHGSQNLVGSLPDTLADVQTLVQALAVAAVWALFARTARTSGQLFAAAAAAVTAFVAFGKVLSPQFLIWLVPLVPLVAGRAALWPGALFAGALLLTQLWFPARYWDVVALEPVAWLVVCRDALLVALVFALLAVTRRAPAARGSP